MNRVIGLVFLTTLLPGCPHRIDFGDKGEIKSADDLLKATAYAESQVVSVKGESKIKIDSPNAKGVLTLFMAVTHPSLIHLESLNFFGKPQAVLISDGATFGLFSADEGKYYRGPASPQNISRFLPVVLPPEELTALMLGRAPRIPADSSELSIDEEKKTYKLVLKKAPVTQTLWIDPKNHRVLRSEVRGVSAYDLAFESIDTVGQVTYPRKVVLMAPAANTTLELLYKDVAVNEAPDLTMFDQTPPANVPIIEVDAAGVPVKATGP
jgi:hypothetical protein